MSDKVVLPQPSRGGSRRGLGYWFSRAACPFKYKLGQDRKLEPVGAMEDPSAADVGTYYHQLLEHYRKGNLPMGVAINHVVGSENENFAEALRMFKGYRTRFPHDEWEHLKIEVEEGVTGEEAEEEFGVPELTVLYDDVALIKEEHLPQIKARRGLDLEPGVYLVDSKCRTRKPSDTDVEWYAYTGQFVGYQGVWNLLHPDMPCKGMLVDTAIRHKNLTENSYRTYLVGPPNQHQRKFLKRQLELCRALGEQRGEDFKNNLVCRDGFSICSEFVNGNCDGGVA